MKTVSAPLLALLQGSSTFVMADLYTIVLKNGTTLRYTDFDSDLGWGAYTFSASGPVLKRGKTRLVIGLEVDTLDVEIYPKATDLINGIGMLASAIVGVFDGATLTLEKAYMAPSAPLAVVGTIIMFSGEFADTQVSRTMIKAKINSDVAMLNVQLPRNIYQPSCSHALFDSDCTLNRAAFAQHLVVGASPTVSQFSSNALQAATFFDRGYVVFTSGGLTGTKRTVKGFTNPGGVFQMFLPLPTAPAPGDTFDAYPGCDKSQATCTSKFSNLINFRGAPYIPVPETAR